MKFLFLILLSFSGSVFAAPETEIKIDVRGYQPINYKQEIVKQEQLFKHIVVELELSIAENKFDSGKPVVQIMPARSVEVDPRF